MELDKAALDRHLTDDHAGEPVEVVAVVDTGGELEINYYRDLEASEVADISAGLIGRLLDGKDEQEAGAVLIAFQSELMESLATQMAG